MSRNTLCAKEQIRFLPHFSEFILNLTKCFFFLQIYLKVEKSNKIYIYISIIFLFIMSFIMAFSDVEQ